MNGGFCQAWIREDFRFYSYRKNLLLFLKFLLQLQRLYATMGARKKRLFAAI
jgi:hypothetical protein